MTASRYLSFAIAHGALSVQLHMRCQISAETCEQIKTAFASGIRLREIACNMGTPGATTSSRASRERWTQRIEAAKSLPLSRPLSADALNHGGPRRTAPRAN